MERHGSAHGSIEAPADLVFATITDLAHLPAWNRRMTGVVELPAELAVGAEWVVGFRIGGKRFNSRSVVEELDGRRRRFVHRSKPDDENPSCTVWTWQVEPEGPGSRVTVRWDLKPLTRGRRLFAAPFRAWQIPRHDVPASLAALARVCEADAAGPGRIGR
jgi:uncharacterized protein YndB with AHSA1/START domain